MFNLEQTAKMYNISIERLKEQYKANAEGLERMYNKAVAPGKRLMGTLPNNSN